MNTRGENEVMELEIIQKDLESNYNNQLSPVEIKEDQIVVLINDDQQSTEKKTTDEDVKIQVKRERKKTQQFSEIQKIKIKKPSNKMKVASVEPVKMKKVKAEPKIVCVPQALMRDEELLPWYIQLEVFQSLLVNLLSCGIPKLTIQIDLMMIKQQYQELNISLSSDNPQPLKIIQKLVASLVENSDYNKSDYQITQDCLEFIKQNCAQETPPENILNLLTFQELIVGMKEKKNYLPKSLNHTNEIDPTFSLKKIYKLCGLLDGDVDDNDELQCPSSLFQVQEVIDKDSLSLYCNQVEFQNNRKIRKYIKRLIESLHKLINLIEKSFKKDQIPKIDEAFKQYVDIKVEKVKLVKIKKDLKEEKVKELKENKQPKESKELKVKEIKEPKETKLPKENKSKKVQSQVQIEPKMQSDKKSPLSKSPLIAPQQKLFCFFNLQTKKPDIQEKKITKSEFFQTLGVKPNNQNWDTIRESQFETMLENLTKREDFQISIKDYIMTGDNQQKKFIKKKRTVYIYIYDSSVVVRGLRFNKSSSLISGRQPLKMGIIQKLIILDEECVDYDMCSKDELEMLTAKSLDSQRDDDKTETFSEIDEEFIVSDGHLSEAEFSDKEDYKIRAIEQERTDNQQLEEQPQRAFSYFVQDREQEQLFSQYKMIKISEGLVFPFQTKKIDESNQRDFFVKYDIMKKFLKLISGSFLSMQKISQRFKETNPECSKYQAEKKLKEIAEKKKGDNNLKERWFIKQDVLDLYQINEESNLKMMQDNEEDFISNRKQKSDKKKQAQLELSNLPPREVIQRYFKTEEAIKIRTPQKSVSPIIIDVDDALVQQFSLIVEENQTQIIAKK